MSDEANRRENDPQPSVPVSPAKPAPDSKTKRRRIISATAIVLFVLLSVGIFLWVGQPMLQLVSQPDTFRAWIDEQGLWGHVVFVGMMVLQIVVAVIPGEPLEIAAGYVFGVWEGTLLCMISAVIGSVLVFCLVRWLGVHAIEVFFPIEKIQSMKFLRNAKRLNLIVFILFLIPGTPKDILTYVVGLTSMKLSTWLLITSFARIPSIITSTIGGDALGLQNYQFAVVVFVITILISVAGLLVYRWISKRENKEQRP